MVKLNLFIVRKLIFYSTLLLLTFSASSQVDNFQAGSYSRSLGDASLTIVEPWAVYNNQAAMAFIDRFAFGVFAENRFSIKELNTGSLVFIAPIGKLGTFGVDFYTFNHSVIYSSQKYGFSYALPFGKKLSAGIKFNLFRTFAEGYNTHLSFCGEIGLMYKVTKNIHLGIHVFNPTAAKYTHIENENIPTTMRIGTGLKLTKEAFLSLEVENTSESDFIFKGGLAYKLGEKFSLQAGIKSKPFTNSFGVTFLTDKLHINISFLYMQVLDSSPGISAEYYLK